MVNFCCGVTEMTFSPTRRRAVANSSEAYTLQGTLPVLTHSRLSYSSQSAWPSTESW